MYVLEDDFEEKNLVHSDYAYFTTGACGMAIPLFQPSLYIYFK
jgi:hypothetical protein